MMGSPSMGASSGMISQPGSPRTSTRPAGPLLPMPAPICSDLQRLLGGRSLQARGGGGDGG